LIDYDHTELLGDTLSKIAIEKAGILKVGCSEVHYRLTGERTTMKGERD